MATIKVLNGHFAGLTFADVRKRVAIVPAIRFSGALWWKKHEHGYAVQLCEKVDICACGQVDIMDYWVNRFFTKDRREAERFAQELEDVYPKGDDDV